jgi:Protein of unknown function (DUF1203)
MSFTITGLAVSDFSGLFGLPDDVLSARGILRRTATDKPGFPCRVTLEDAEPGETLLLLNHESHSADTPYRSRYAIYVREKAREAAAYVDTLPPVLTDRPLALRLFDRHGMLVGAELSQGPGTSARINAALACPEVDHVDIHNAAHGCFTARAVRSYPSAG